jgi:aldehyde:ferredoxin oxidoreductase
MNDNLPSIAYGNHLCNIYGLDTISTGNVIAFAMECFEKGILNKEKVGIDMTWGNHRSMVRMIEMIAHRQGLGDILAEGVKRSSERIGGKQFAVHVKGLEIPMHEPRGKKGVGLSYVTSPRGGCHVQSSHDPFFEKGNVIPELGLTEPMSRYATKGKPYMVKQTQDMRGTINSMLVCLYTVDPTYRPVTVTDLVELVSYTTGWELNVKEFMLFGERANNICQIFNVREGLTRKDDRLPSVFSNPLIEGPAKGQRITVEDLDRMLDEYYQLREWDKTTGIPTKDKMKQLGIPHFNSIS